ncbi:S1 family peptidase [Geminocystis sp. CENA526]|uniref:S1 family peptidase n=1 Tax=Geminocystis sp. CENA526 TaxID=1355871 RepID=UPI003D6DE7EA
MNELGKFFNFKLFFIFIFTLFSLQISHQSLSIINSTIEQQQIIKDIVADLFPIAKAITVKVNLDEGFASGVLVARQGKNFFIVTNAHVIRGGKSPYQVETFDGKTYEAEVEEMEKLKDKDMTILKFHSPTMEYLTAEKGKLPKKDDFVLAVGFTQRQPQNNENEEDLEPIKPKFEVLTGKVTLVLDKPLKQGYQIGYSNPVVDGMSGGAILNKNGELVGINAMRAYAILGDPYVYEDDTIPRDSLRELMIKSSWGIPIFPSVLE